MHIICKKCKQEVSAANLLGHLVGKGVKLIGPYMIAYYVQSYNLQRRTWSDQMAKYLVGTADAFEIPCSVCEKHEGWIVICDNNIEYLSLEKQVDKHSEL